LVRVAAAVIRQQMGHASSEMTALYTGEIPVEQVAKHFQLEPKWTGGCSLKTSVSGEVVGRKD
jgi:hypothetical protein